MSYNTRKHPKPSKKAKATKPKPTRKPSRTKKQKSSESSSRYTQESDSGSEPHSPQPSHLPPLSDIPITDDANINPDLDDLQLTIPPSQDHNARWFFCTLNNYGDRNLIIESLKSDYSLAYWLVGFEVGSEEHTPHCHIIIKPHNPCKWSTIKNKWPDANIQCGKHFLAAIAYVKKDGDWVRSADGELFETEKQQGRRSDLLQVAASIREYGFIEAAVKHPTATIKYFSGMRCYAAAYSEQLVKPKPKVYWLYGASGNGKTQWGITMAIAKGMGYYINGNCSNWFDGYDPALHKMVILDDVRNAPDQWPLARLLLYTDTIPIKAPVKGGFVNWIPHYIVITSVHHPKHSSMYGACADEDYIQVARRITYIKCMYERFHFFNANVHVVRTQPHQMEIVYKWTPIFNHDNITPDLEDLDNIQAQELSIQEQTFRISNKPFTTTNLEDDDDDEDEIVLNPLQKPPMAQTTNLKISKSTNFNVPPESRHYRVATITEAEDNHYREREVKDIQDYYIDQGKYGKQEAKTTGAKRALLYSEPELARGREASAASSNLLGESFWKDAEQRSLKTATDSAAHKQLINEESYDFPDWREDEDKINLGECAFPIREICRKQKFKTYGELRTFIRKQQQSWQEEEEYLQSQGAKLD